MGITNLKKSKKKLDNQTLDHQLILESIKKYN